MLLSISSRLTDSIPSDPLVPEIAEALYGEVEARQHSPRMGAVRHVNVQYVRDGRFRQ